MGTNSSAEAPEIGCQSTPNLKFLQVTSDIWIPEPSEHRDSKGSLERRQTICIYAEYSYTTRFSWQDTWRGRMVIHAKSKVSTGHRRYPDTGTVRTSWFQGFAGGRQVMCTYMPNIAVHLNIAGDAPDLGLLSVTSWRQSFWFRIRRTTGWRPVTAAAKHRRPRRSIWNRTNKFLRRLFCFCGSIDIIYQ